MARRAALVVAVIGSIALFAERARSIDGFSAVQTTSSSVPLGPVVVGPTGTASIAGRVFVAETGEPVRGADIRARGDYGVRDTVTDENGRFDLRDLPSGAWRVTASKGGFIAWQAGQRRPFETPPPIALAAGRRAAVEIPLWRGGVIAGRIYDEFSEPVAAVRVNVYRTRTVQGRRRLQSIGSGDYTDDTGAFRVYGLPPGDYYVAASMRVAPAGSVIETTYAPTYHPGTGNLAEAQRVPIGYGTEAHADFQLLPVRAVSIEGTVFTSAGTAADAFLSLSSEAAELGAPHGAGGATRPDGTFTLPDVAPGHYVLTATLRGSGSAETAEIPVTVGHEPVAGVTLVTARGATVRGSFVPADGVTRPLPRGLGIAARSARSDGRVVRGTTSESRFEITDVSGPLSFSIDGVPDGWTVHRIVVNGIDATDEPIAVSSGQDATARVELSDRVTEVSGAIDSLGSPGDVSVVVFPEDSSKWVYPSRYVRTVRADAQGRYRILGLPRGEQYRAVAVDYLEEGEGDDPDFLARVRPFSMGFSFAEQEGRALDLPLLVR